MRIGILGAGALAQAFAHRAITSGHEVVLSNSRGPASLQSVVDALGEGALAGTRLQAADQEVVVLAVPADRVAAALSGLPAWTGRTLVDATNDLTQRWPLTGELTSSELVAALAPEAHVVKALNTVLASTLRKDPGNSRGDRRVLFISGDDEPSKDALRRLFEGLGFATIDLGWLAEGGRMQQFPGGPLSAVNLVKVAWTGNAASDPSALEP